MTLRSLLRTASPWRDGYVCCDCGSRARQPWDLPRDCRREGHMIQGRVLAPWVRPILGVVLVVAAYLLLVLLASRASASESWSGSLQWRGEVVRVTSECGPIRGAGILRELEAGYQRATRDLAGTGVAVPPLGEPGKPYTIQLLRAPGCPSNAIACSTTLPGAPKWSVVKALCGAGKKKNGDRALDHERMHAYCLKVRPLVVPPRTLAELRTIAPACALADHLASKTERFDVAARRVPR